jgi:hypothetical protein
VLKYLAILFSVHRDIQDQFLLYFSICGDCIFGNIGKMRIKNVDRLINMWTLCLDVYDIGTKYEKRRGGGGDSLSGNLIHI